MHKHESTNRTPNRHITPPLHQFYIVEQTNQIESIGKTGGFISSL